MNETEANAFPLYDVEQHHSATDRSRNVTSSNVTDDYAEVYWQSASHVRVDQQLLIYLLPVIIVVGTVGNMASVVVLLRARMRIVSVYLYLLLLAVADTTVLYTSAFKTWLRLVTGVEWLHTSDAACRALMFTLAVSLHLSAWLVVLTTADRFVAVWFPLKTATFCSHDRARLATVLLLLAIALFDGHLLWTYKLQFTGETINGVIHVLKCLPAPEVADFMSIPFEYLKMVTYNVVPFIIILTLNVAIVARLRSSTPIRYTVGQGHHNQGQGQGQNQAQGQTKQHSASCFSACCFCCYCTTGTTSSSSPGASDTSVTGKHYHFHQNSQLQQQQQHQTAAGTTWPPQYRYSMGARPTCRIDAASSLDKDTAFDNARHSTFSTDGNSVSVTRRYDGMDIFDDDSLRHSTQRRCETNTPLNVHTRVTSMLLTVSFVWLALTTPFIVQGFVFVAADLDHMTAYRLLPFKAICFLLMYTNHAINFYLYCLTGRKFRRELRDICVGLRRWCAGRRSVTSCWKHDVVGGGGKWPRGRNNTIELPSRTELGTRLTTMRKSDV